MSKVRAAEVGIVEAPASTVYAILADYREGHPAILPREHFPLLEVEEGGVGNGTRIRFHMRAFGKIQEARAEIVESRPGRVLMERMLDERETITRFLVDPIDETSCRVTILTEWTARGAAGWLERLVAPGMLRKIFRAELRNLAAYVRSGAPATAS